MALYSLSFGSYWGARFAATDHRLAAAAVVWASICDKYYLFEEESPRYKQLFAFLTGARSEEELDALAEEMDIPYAYVVFDHHRAASLRTIHSWMEGVGLYPCGRFGEWGYHWSFEAIESGKRVAARVSALAALSRTAAGEGN